MKRHTIFFVLFVGIFFASFGAVAQAETISISSPSLTYSSQSRILTQLEFGMNGNEVKALQVFLAATPDVYPEKLVTGYYGSLTEQAVKKFQQKYGLPIVGRVGPQTLKKVNELFEKNGTLAISSLVSENISPNAIRVSWTTDNPATTKVLYSTSTDVMSGTATWSVNDTHLSQSHVVDIFHLTASTTYSVIVISTNASGNATATSRISLTTPPQN